MSMTYRFSATAPGNLELGYEEEKKIEQATPVEAVQNAAPPQTGAKQPALNALTASGIIQKLDNPRLNDTQLQMLLKMDAVDNQDGGFDLYRNDGSNQPAMTVDKNGSVGLRQLGAVDSTETINGIMEAAQMYKTLHPGEICYVSAKDEQRAFMMAYVCEKAGLEVRNQTGTKLDDLAKTDPQYADLRNKIDVEWDKKYRPVSLQNAPYRERDTSYESVPGYETIPVPEQRAPNPESEGDTALKSAFESIMEELENNVRSQTKITGSGTARDWGTIPKESRSGLQSPVPEGLGKRFEGCATGIAPLGAPMPQTPAQDETLDRRQRLVQTGPKRDDFGLG